ncbi:hypothetical protein JCM3775_001089 [Rhodotorula graminis]|uniref:Uncharacterized protein n=1 Tax=Rhodotorula graminis (strain WP1) TaxID=578459 RepID=A0A194S2R7_RHOGW|nr:uncharacterized protein RHOBADRAFT_53739 [Rhodotorula graminis WP1]KPV74800.1 hypothetical protein RHOBADRAFT_53739 [Rhodotorula graminis WP1]
MAPAPKSTPPRFATDLTNLARQSASSSSSAKRPSTYRQTSLADSRFFRSTPPAPVAPPTSSPSPSAAADAPSVFGSDAPPLSDASNTSPVRVEDGACAHDGLDDESVDGGDDGDDGDEREARTKRRRVASHDSVPSRRGAQAWAELGTAQLVGTYGTGDSEGRARIEPTFVAPGQQFGAFEAMRRRELGFRAGTAHLSMRPWLQTIVSSNEADVARLPSIHQRRHFAPPFALAFSYGAKQGGRKIVAVGDEEGTVSFLDGDEDQWAAGPSRHSFDAHRNAIFDLSWSYDDALIATASGDQTVHLWDTETQACIGVLAGHTGTVKNITWDPHNPYMLSTASRDGTIRVWDTRVKGYADVDIEGASAVGAVNHIKNAHGVRGKTAKGQRSATRSVTSVAYMYHQENLLASAGSADGSIKVWDLRRSHSRRINPATFETNDDALLSTMSARPHGISHMTLAPDGRKLYALSTDSHVYAYSATNLTHAAPLATFHSPQARYSTFYIRCAVSPDSRYLATGSSSGDVFMWDTEGQGTAGEAVRVKGHTREVSGLDWGHESLATCSDDNLVRFWRSDPALSRARRAAASADWQDDHEGWRLGDRWSGEVVDAA